LVLAKAHNYIIIVIDSLSTLTVIASPDGLSVSSVCRRDLLIDLIGFNKPLK
jgi:hypothetical protein